MGVHSGPTLGEYAQGRWQFLGGSLESIWAVARNWPYREKQSSFRKRACSDAAQRQVRFG